MATARLTGSPRLRHPGPCGDRARCPRGCNAVVPTLELLACGDLLVRCCEARAISPGDPAYAEFRAAFP